MKPKPRRRRRKGVLSGLRSSTKGDKHRKPQTLWNKVLTWSVGSLAIAAMGFVIVLLFWRMMSPDYGMEEGEASFPVVRVEEYGDNLPAGVDEDRVADAIVDIEGREAFFRLTAEQLEAVRGGAGIRARYRLYPLSQRNPVVIDEWSVEGAPAAPAPVPE